MDADLQQRPVQRLGPAHHPGNGHDPGLRLHGGWRDDPAIDINFGANGLTQFADPNGQLVPNRISQDGYPTGTIQRVQVGEGGRVMGSYSNGQTVPLAQIPLAQFPADNLLKRQDAACSRKPSRVDRNLWSTAAATSWAARSKTRTRTSRTSSRR